MKNQEGKNLELPQYEDFSKMSFEQLKETYDRFEGFKGGLETMFYTPVDMISLVAKDKLKCKKENKKEVLSKIEYFVTESDFIIDLEEKGKVLTFSEGVDLFSYIVNIVNESNKGTNK